MTDARDYEPETTDATTALVKVVAEGDPDTMLAVLEAKYRTQRKTKRALLNALRAEQGATPDQLTKMGSDDGD